MGSIDVPQAKATLMQNSDSANQHDLLVAQHSTNLTCKFKINSLPHEPLPPSLQKGLVFVSTVPLPSDVSNCTASKGREVTTTFISTLYCGRQVTPHVTTWAPTPFQRAISASQRGIPEESQPLETIFMVVKQSNPINVTREKAYVLYHD